MSITQESTFKLTLQIHDASVSEVVEVIYGIKVPSDEDLDLDISAKDLSLADEAPTIDIEYIDVVDTATGEIYELDSIPATSVATIKRAIIARES